jgi:molybdopterin-guanine dinucleotide biosynthesis protein A
MSRAAAAILATPALYGLVLAGGRSSRMGRDKAALTYGGETPQLARAMALIGQHVVRAFVSVRADQTDDPLRARYAQIVDTLHDIGPIAGLLAAQAAYPQAAWLVLACDLPLLDERTLTHLLRSRDQRRTATAYRSSHDGLPEPLCAIYEPASAAQLDAHFAGGIICPRKFLKQADTLLIDEPDPHALDNINTPADYGSAMEQVGKQPAGKTRRVAVQYYALLREQAGKRAESVETDAATPAQLYAQLSRRYPFTLPPEVLRVAINNEFRDWLTPLADGDAVVFIPPVAGG